MMMPNKVRNVLNLFDQRELMAIETDSLRFILAIFRINILHYMIRKRKAKVYWGQVLFFAFAHINAIYIFTMSLRALKGRGNLLR